MILNWIDPKILKNNKVTLSYTLLQKKVQALSGIERPIVGSMEFLYDSSDRCTQVTDYRSNSTVLGFNTSMQRTRVVDAESKVFTFTYNSESQMLTSMVSLQSIDRTSI